MRYLVLAFLLSVVLFAQEEKRADCILLEDENSIICKYQTPRSDFENNITIEWVDPNKEISRTRKMTIPPHHGSVYDYRYLEGRMKGIWTFRVIDSNQTYSTQFTIK